MRVSLGRCLLASCLVLPAACLTGDRSGWSAPERFERSDEPVQLSAASAPATRSASPSAASAPRAASASTSADDDYWQQQLATRMPGFVVVEEESLRRVVDQVRTITGLPMVVTSAAEEATLDAGTLFDLRFENPIAVKSVLDLICEFTDGDVVWVIRHDTVLFTTPDKAYSQVLGTYDVRHLTAVITDFAAPEIGVHPSGYDPEESRGGPVGSRPRLEEDALLELVQDNVAPASWDAEGASLDLRKGMLFARNTPDVQERLEVFLARLGGW